MPEGVVRNDVVEFLKQLKQTHLGSGEVAR
jgi:hypothetical protein